MPSLATAEQPQGGSAISLLIFALPILLIGLMIFSQRRRARQFEQAQAELTIGSEVSTTSGLRGRLAALGDDTAQIEAAPGVVLTFDRRAVVPTSVISGASSSSADSTSAADSGGSKTSGASPAPGPESTDADRQDG